MIDRNSTNVALENIFEQIFAMVSQASRVPFTDTIFMDEGKLVNLLDELREAIPREIKNASQVLDDKKSIVSRARQDAEVIVQNAKIEAESIVSAAREQADAMVQQEEVVAQANATAEEIKQNALHYQADIQTAADEYALQVKQDALKYADDMLNYLSDSMSSALAGMAENRQSIENEIGKLLRPEAQPEEEAGEQL